MVSCFALCYRQLSEQKAAFQEFRLLVNTCHSWYDIFSRCSS